MEENKKQEAIEPDAQKKGNKSYKTDFLIGSIILMGAILINALGIFGILIIIGFPGLVYSICKRAGK